MSCVLLFIVVVGFSISSGVSDAVWGFFLVFGLVPISVSLFSANCGGNFQVLLVFWCLTGFFFVLWFFSFALSFAVASSRAAFICAQYFCVFCFACVLDAL